MQSTQNLAFISYANVDFDRLWAGWLFRRIDNYRIPKYVQKEHNVEPRLGRIYFDYESAQSGTPATELLTELRNSHTLIVICSPNAAKSEWVCRETEYFINHHENPNVIPVLIAGTPINSYPKAILELSELDQPLRAELKVAKGYRARYVRERELTKIISYLINCPFEDLRERRLLQSRMRAWKILSFTTIIIIFLLGMTIVAWNEKRRADNHARNAKKTAAMAREFANHARRRLKIIQIAADAAILQALEEEGKRMLYEQDTDINRINEWLQEVMRIQKRKYLEDAYELDLELQGHDNDAEFAEVGLKTFLGVFSKHRQRVAKLGNETNLISKVESLKENINSKK